MPYPSELSNYTLRYLHCLGVPLILRFNLGIADRSSLLSLLRTISLEKLLAVIWDLMLCVEFILEHKWVCFGQ